MGDRAEEGRAYGNPGVAYDSLSYYQQAIKYHKKDLSISKELSNRYGEGRAYGSLGNVHQLLGDFQQAIEYHKKHQSIFKDLGVKVHNKP